MQPQLVVRQLGGIAHRRALRDRGIRPRDLAITEEMGSLRRVRRDWFAVPECSPDLVAAVRVGGRLTCTSAADMQHVWAVPDGALHVAVAPTAARLHLHEAPRTVVHWNRPVVPVDPGSAIEPIENVLAHIAPCQPLDFAVAAFDSAVRTGAIPLRQLRALAATQGSAFRRVVALVNPLADTGIESIPRVRFGRLGIVMVPQVLIDGHHVDGLIGERLVMQFDGYGPHSDRVQRNRDLHQDARLVVQDYSVLRFSRDQVLDDWDFVLASTLTTIAEGGHLWPR
jgi:very-short-patch-repair endonuclease